MGHPHCVDGYFLPYHQPETVLPTDEAVPLTQSQAQPVHDLDACDGG